MTGSFPLLMVASFASIIGGIVIFFKKQWSEEALYAMVSIGAGLLLAITMFHMLPQAAGHPNQGMMQVVMLGFIFLFVVDMISRRQREESERGKLDGAVIGFVIHAFTEGLSLAASFQVSPKLGFSLLLALLFHKIPEGVTIASLLLAATKQRSTAFLGSAVLGVATLLGVFVAQLAERFVSAKVTDLLLAFSAGVFLYVSASHLVPYIRQSGNARTSFYFLGAIIVYVLVSVMSGTNVHHHA